jgi:hypothetical protein
VFIFGISLLVLKCTGLTGDILQTRKVGLFISIIALISALNVVVPTDNYDAVKYGASVGVFTAIIALSGNLQTTNVFLLVALIIFVCVWNALAVYNISTSLGWYPIEPC